MYICTVKCLFDPVCAKLNQLLNGPHVPSQRVYLQCASPCMGECMRVCGYVRLTSAWCVVSVLNNASRKSAQVSVLCATCYVTSGASGVLSNSGVVCSSRLCVVNNTIVQYAAVCLPHHECFVKLNVPVCSRLTIY